MASPGAREESSLNKFAVEIKEGGKGVKVNDIILALLSSHEKIQLVLILGVHRATDNRL